MIREVKPLRLGNTRHIGEFRGVPRRCRELAARAKIVQVQLHTLRPANVSKSNEKVVQALSSALRCSVVDCCSRASSRRFYFLVYAVYRLRCKFVLKQVACA